VLLGWQCLNHTYALGWAAFGRSRPNGFNRGETAKFRNAVAQAPWDRVWLTS